MSILDRFWKRAMYEYYKITPDMQIEEIIRRWVVDSDKGRSGMVMMPVESVLPYREYVWSPELSRLDEEGWNKLVEDMKEGWNTKDPAIIFIGKNGRAKVGEGNHRLAIAEKMGMKEVPVRFVFWQNVSPYQEGQEPWEGMAQPGELAQKTYDWSEPTEKISTEELADEIMRLLGER